MGVILLLVVALFLMGVARTTMLRVSDVGERDVRWLQQVGTTNASVFAHIRSYLVRLRIHRWAGGVLGAVGALLIAGLTGSRPTVVIGAGSPWSDLVFCGLGGMLVGSVVAESTRVVPELISGPESGTVPGAWTEPTPFEPASWVFIALTLAVGLVEWTRSTMILAILAIVTAGVHSLFLAVIRSGYRPLAALDLRHADGAIRSYAARRFSMEALAASLLLFGWQWGAVVFTGSTWGSILRFICVGVAGALLVQSRPYPSS